MIKEAVPNVKFETVPLLYVCSLFVKELFEKIILFAGVVLSERL